MSENRRLVAFNNVREPHDVEENIRKRMASKELVYQSKTNRVMGHLFNIMLPILKASVSDSAFRSVYDDMFSYLSKELKDTEEVEK